MKNKLRFINIILFLTVTIMFSFNSIYGTSMLNTIISQGSSWFNPASGTQQGTLATDINNLITTEIIPAITTIGNLIFFIVAIFLGIKYIWSGIEGKSVVKETLPTFTVGVMFFYLAQMIYNFANGSLLQLVNSASSYTTMEGRIFSTVIVLAQIFSFMGICAVGVKYMLSSADTRADIKKVMLPMVLGMVLVFSTSAALNFIVNAGKEAL